MQDLSRLARNAAPAKTSVEGGSTASLPALNSHAAKPVVLAVVLPALPNAAKRPVVALVSGLPRASRARMMTPAGVPLTDASRFVNPL
jgi:hypothetical protein